MKVEYCVEPIVDVFIDKDSDIPEKFCLDGADVYLEVSVIHPNHNKGHITSGGLELLDEVSAKSEKLERIAELLLKHKK
ncbi:MAG: hypothetical protein D3903_10905 [Candidatus Electrothrix sp. GM3_4]|nr:hypothetical protein [Candidatus Electrothrix sp. GM3_4]